MELSAIFYDDDIDAFLLNDLNILCVQPLYYTAPYISHNVTYVHPVHLLVLALHK